MARLNRTFDPAMMQRELSLAESSQSNPAGYPGEGHRAWTSLCIYSDSSIDPQFGAGNSRPRLPYLNSVLEQLSCPVYLARLMTLEPGGLIAEHRDPFLGFDSGLLRLHVPIVTHPDVSLYISGMRCNWNVGELWYGDFSQPHFGANRSTLTRTHLVVDVAVCEETLRLFPDEFKAHCSQTKLLSKQDGSNFLFSFRLPRGFQLPGMPPLASDMTGKVVYFGGIVFVTLAAQPFLRLLPTDDSTLEVLGLPIAAKLSVSRSANVISSATLTLSNGGAERVSLNLEVVP